MSWDDANAMPPYDVLWEAYWSLRYVEEREEYPELVDLGGEG